MGENSVIFSDRNLIKNSDLKKTMAQIIETGGNGNCLFTSIGSRLGVDHLEIRKKIGRYVLRNPDRELMQETIRYWIEASQYRCVHRYCSEIVEPGNLGSALEIALISKIYNQRIVVWIPVDGRNFSKGIRSIAEYSGERPSIHLLFLSKSAHYQVLDFD